MMLHVHIDEPSPRARYTIEHVLHHMLGWTPVFTASLEEFQQITGPRLRYGQGAGDGGGYLHVPASGWLGRKDRQPFEPAVGRVGDMPVLFPSAEGYDPFAGTFYLLSRYEEYAGNDPDRHDRLVSMAHFVVKHGIERIPVVDLWALQLARDLRAIYPELPLPARTYNHIITVDVDNGLKYLGRPVWKQWGAVARDIIKGDHTFARERIAVLTGMAPDPYDRYDLLEKAAQQPGVDRLIAFFLMCGNSSFDHAASSAHPQMRKIIGRIHQQAEVGIHPSYESSRREELIGTEAGMLSAITQAPITRSRQHFLRWRMPETLRALEKLGMNEEHSMGFADRSGFRAGTCTPFHWYDLEQERVSDLVLHPFTTMDSALGDQKGMGPVDAVAEMLRMSDVVREVNGTFISVWHDRFLSGDHRHKGWPEAFQHVLLSAAS
jgi:hypothetical protein